VVATAASEQAGVCAAPAVESWRAIVRRLAEHYLMVSRLEDTVGSTVEESSVVVGAGDTHWSELAEDKQSAETLMRVQEGTSE
jgi:hypothetical protein